VVKLAREFGAKIDNKNIIFNRDNLDELLNSLDRYFKEWEELVKKK
jgi:hypothetical protein